MKMNNKVYDVLKWITLIVFPAILGFYGLIGGELNIPYTEEVLTIGNGFITCLGTCLGISTMNYNKTKEE